MLNYKITFLIKLMGKKNDGNLSPNVSLSDPMLTDYSKCSDCGKFSYTNCLPKRHRQTEQTQIRLLLQKQSDQ